MNHLLDKLDEIPPFIVRAIARTGGKSGRLLTNSEIAKASGLSISVIEKIGNSRSWSNISISDAGLFFEACRINPFHLSRQKEFLKRMWKSKNGLKGVRHLQYGKTKPLWQRASQKRQLEKLVRFLREMP